MFLRTLGLLALVSTVLLGSPGAISADDPTIATHSRWVTSANFSKDGALLATGGGQSLLYRPGDVVLWDAASGKQLANLKGHESCVWSVAITPDQKTLISAGYDGKIIIWDMEAKKSRQEVEQKGWLRSVAISADGQLFAAAGESGEIVIRKVADGSDVRTIKAHDSTVFQVAFSPDNSLLASASADKTAKVFAVADGAEKAKLEGHEDAVWTVAFSPSGEVLATAGADRKIRLWNKEWKQTEALEGHRNWISALAFSADGQKLVSGDLGRALRVWTLADKKTVKDVSGASSIWTVAVASNGRVVAGSHKDSLRLWDLASGNELMRNPEDHAKDTPPPPPKPEPMEEKKDEEKKDEAKKDEAKKDEAKKDD